MVEAIVWIDPDGASTTLHTSANYFVGWNVSGRGSPGVTYDEEAVPEQPGLRLLSVLHNVREFSLPVWVQGSSESDLRVKLRALASSMNPVRGDGTIRITTPVGDQREILCRVSSGLEWAEKIGETSNLTAQMLPLVFRAHSPYWQDASDTAVSWMQGAAPGGWFPFDGFPSLSSSEIFADAAVVNSGDVDTWPVWTITGPTSTVVLRNVTTGKQMTLVYGIPPGEVVTIDTRPGRKTLRTLSGQNLWPLLSGTSALWPLSPGSNTVRVEAGTTSTATQVQLVRRHQYLTV